MILALVAVALALLALPGLTGRVGRRLPPREWTWLCAAALTGGLVLLEVAVLLRAAPPALRALGVRWLASACERLVGPLLAGGPVLSWVAGAAAVALPAAAVVVWRQGKRVRRGLAAELWLGERRSVAGHAVVVLPVSRALALSFAPTRHDGVIVISEGLLVALAPLQVEAVVRHEAAHLRHGHQRLLVVAAVAAGALGWVPTIGRSAAELHLAVERWADEWAAQSSPATRNALRDSLVALAGVYPAAGVAAFADAGTLAARIMALESPPPRPPVTQHALLYLPGGAAGLVAAPALASWANHLHMVLAMSGRCSA